MTCAIADDAAKIPAAAASRTMPRVTRRQRRSNDPACMTPSSRDGLARQPRNVSISKWPALAGPSREIENPARDQAPDRVNPVLQSSRLVCGLVGSAQEGRQSMRAARCATKKALGYTSEVLLSTAARLALGRSILAVPVAL